MSGTPNLCIDIFTQISNMLGNLQRVASDPNNTFTHGSGFSNDAGLQPVQQNPSDPTSLLAWIMIAVMVFFLMFGGRTREPEDLKANVHRGNMDGNNNNDSDDSIH